MLSAIELGNTYLGVPNLHTILDYHIWWKEPLLISGFRSKGIMVISFWRNSFFSVHFRFSLWERKDIYQKVQWNLVAAKRFFGPKIDHTCAIESDFNAFVQLRWLIFWSDIKIKRSHCTCLINRFYTYWTTHIKEAIVITISKIQIYFIHFLSW